MQDDAHVELLGHSSRHHLGQIPNFHGVSEDSYREGVVLIVWLAHESRDSARPCVSATLLVVLEAPKLCSSKLQSEQVPAPHVDELPRSDLVEPPLASVRPDSECIHGLEELIPT